MSIISVLIITSGVFLFDNLKRVDQTKITLSDSSFSDTSLSIVHINNPRAFQYFQFILPTESKNVVDCKNYASYELSYTCYQALATLHKDAKYCRNIERNFDTNYMHIDDCYSMVAKETGDISICENINNKEPLTGPYSDCIASIRKDVSMCPPLESPGSDYNGSYSCYLNAATEGKYLSICDKFGKDKNSRATCYEEVAVAKNDASICKNGTLNDTQKDHCFSKMVSNYGNDISLCTNIHDVATQNRCQQIIKQRIISNSNDINACNSFLTQDNRNSCFWEIADTQNNPLLCENISGDELSTNQCVTQSSPAMTNPSICESLKDIHYGEADRDICYFQYATLNQKLEICNNISDESLKNKCVGSYLAKFEYKIPEIGIELFLPKELSDLKYVVNSSTSVSLSSASLENQSKYCLAQYGPLGYLEVIEKKVLQNSNDTNSEWSNTKDGLDNAVKEGKAKEFSDRYLLWMNISDPSCAQSSDTANLKSLLVKLIKDSVLIR